MSGWSKDIQIDGSFDDGSNDGAVRAKLVSGELIRLPFWYGEYAVEAGTGSSVSSFNQNSLANQDGSMGHALVAVPADPLRTGAGLRLWVPFRGRVFGVRWTKDQNYQLTDFSIAVDGVAYGPARATFDYQRVTYEGSAQSLFTEGTFMVDDLPDGEHTAEIHVAADPFVAKQMDFYGILVERRAGYTEHPRTLSYQGPYFVPSLLTSIATTVSGTATLLGYSNARGIRQIAFHNTDAAAPHVVTLYSANSATAANEIRKIYLDKAGASQADTYVWDEGERMAWGVIQAWYWIADAASTVNATMAVGS